ncbi:MAG: hypothetical protein NZ957_04270 [Thaumarchaeota archaeon]|nr:hypothetical protein [Candidatus Calditenuaceae archaeon]MDW8041875.1 hypothetical protein [Nitrososphaerota archaeon]
MDRQSNPQTAEVVAPSLALLDAVEEGIAVVDDVTSFGEAVT